MSADITPYQSQYFAWLLSRRMGADSADMLAATLVDAQVDLNPHQVDAALFAFESPLSKGVILADEVGLGKTIEAGLVIAQRWAERKRRILVIVPANLRKQWHQELQDKFSLQALILEAKSYSQQRKSGHKRPFDQSFNQNSCVIICSYQFAKSKAEDLKLVSWDLVVMDEAHRLRNVYKPGNVIGKALKEALAHAPKVLLTATPLQNSLLELYGLVSMVDDRVFGDLASFRDQFGALGNADTFAKLRARLATVCKRTLRRQVQPYISYTKRIPLVQEFTPSADEQALHVAVAEYLRRPISHALPAGQRQLISLVLWKLLASSSYAIAGALGTMAQRLEDKLVEHFRDSARIMIATEAGAEGINLQFCSLVINYDLPWNPQRIEQRIGRCHRYGQKHDVVVVNFIDRSNAADRRVYELLAQKFQLFEGVFGASDEVLGAVGSGVDFERRIADIYQTCRDPQQIETSFKQLQLDLSGEINTAMLKTRQLLLENFDEAVQDKLKLRQAQSINARSRFEQLLMALTRIELQGRAVFDDEGFTLASTPAGLSPDDAPPGRYELPRRSGDAHLYRTGHPLAQALIDQAKNRKLPMAKLSFSYEGYGNKISTLEALRGQSGWLALSVLSIEALGITEDYLLMAGMTDAGEALHDEDPEKLLRLPAQAFTSPAHQVREPGAFEETLKRLENQHIREVNQRNLGYFEAEVQKLDAWADDLKFGLEHEVKELDREIKDVRRTAAVSATLEEKLNWQKRQRELEDKRNQLRRKIFDRQDEVDGQRSRLIDDLESRLSSRAQNREIFTVQWGLN